jgi:hypothetical protein
MIELFSRSGLKLLMVAVSATGFACGSDQKQPSSAEDVAPASTGTLPAPTEVTSPPNGQPTDLPPSNPPPQSFNAPPSVPHAAR